MPTDLRTAIRTDEVAQIVESVFGTMLSLDVSPSGAPWFPSGNRLTSAVHLTGDWNGAVLLECNKTQACRFAERFLGTDPCDAVDDVVRDVLGELANMIGGNMKGVLDARVHLSMPSVVDGSDYSLRFCGAAKWERLAFQCSGDFFWVTIVTTGS
jgi:chemotaxis protein CheX